jgi:hypothetical protein
MLCDHVRIQLYDDDEDKPNLGCGRLLKGAGRRPMIIQLYT